LKIIVKTKFTNAGNILHMP